MGQNMAIGLVTEIQVAKKDTQRLQYDILKLQEKMTEAFYFNADLYDVIETDESFIFNIKGSILQEQLALFLQKIYPMLYRDSLYFEGIVEKLQTLSPEEILEWAKEKPEEAFQYSEDNSRDYLYGNFGNSIKIYYSSILLSLEGKVMMETYGRQFNFFKNMIIQSNQEFTIAHAMRVFLTQ